MDDQNRTPEPNQEPTIEPTGDDGGGQPSNNEWKNDARTQRITKQLADLQRKDEERKAAAEKARRDADLKRAEDEGRYKDALAQVEKEKESLAKQHAREIEKRDLENKLLGNKFEDRHFIDSVMSKYDSKEHGTIDEYVKELASNEANHKYMLQSDGKPTGPVIPPGKLPTGGSMKGVNPAEIKAMQRSNDPKQRAEARRFLKEYADKNNNSLPEGF